jgi:hypothetical protein
MRFRKLSGNNSVLRIIGLWAIVVGGLLRFTLHPSAHFGRGLVDGALGLVYGIAIGTLLLSLRRNQSACSQQGS